MTGTWAERRTIVATFGEEIRPLLAAVSSAIDRLLHRPGDPGAAAAALSGLETLQSASSLLEIPGFEVLLRSTREAVDTLVGTAAVEESQRTAIRQLADLLLQEGVALSDGEPADLSASPAADDAPMQVATLEPELEGAILEPWERRALEAAARLPLGADTAQRIEAASGAAGVPPIRGGPPVDAPAGADNPEALAIFAVERVRLFEVVVEARIALQAAPDSQPALDDLAQAAHTLRGAAALVDAQGVSEVCSLIERATDYLAAAGLPISPGGLAFLATAEAALKDLTAAPRTELPGDTMTRLEQQLEALVGPAPYPAFDVEVRALFLEEAEEHLANVNRALVGLHTSPGDSAHLSELRRAVHTLKSASASVGLSAVANLCHIWEDALDPEVVGEAATKPELGLLMECTAAVEHYLRSPDSEASPATFAPLVTRLAATIARTGDTVPGTSLSPAATNGSAAHAPIEHPGAADLAAASPGTGGEVLRVPLERVATLSKLIGELVVERSGLMQQLGHMRLGLEELGSTLERLRRLSLTVEDRLGQSHGAWTPGAAHPTQHVWGSASATGSAVEFDTLELDRYSDAHLLACDLTELIADLAATRLELAHRLDESLLAGTRQGRTITDLNDELLAMRLVPMAHLTLRLQGAVRQAAAECGKTVHFALEGSETLLDKTLLEALADPLLHLLRNAVDHGIEPPDERMARGKPSHGTVRVTAARERNEVVVQVCDDGAGINVADVLAQARQRGLIGTETPDDAVLAQELIFAPGLSTSRTVTGLSGRGMGLDAVRARLAQAKGTLAVTSTPGQGTVFTVRLPSLVVVTPALVVVAGGQSLALPLADVRRVLRVPPDSLVADGETPMLPLDNDHVSVRTLSEVLGWPSPPPTQAPASLLVIVAASGQHQLALLVDDILGQQQTVVKTPAPPFDVLPGIAGVSAQGDGSVLPVLNLLELLEEPTVSHAWSVPPAASAVTVRTPEAPSVLVVDDSRSVRCVLARTLERHGWRVHEARDGAHALEVLQTTTPSVLLLDIEMPRMDGYTLAGTLKAQPFHRHIPIVMLTSRGGEKHRRKAFDMGVDAYLVKPYQEAELVQVLRDVALSP
jgi:chemosensory pili system protein ChpA (sensor histidine kinase/response regulator)